MIAPILVALVLGAAPPPESTVLLREGQPAPWTGWLVEEQRLSLALIADAERAECLATLEIERGDCAADVRLSVEELAACRGEVDALRVAGREAVAPATDWWPVVGAGVAGLVLGGLVVGLVVVVVD